VLAGRDLMAAAQTGTGKTAAFAVPLLQLLAMEGPKVAANSVRALILVPTRELAEQVHASALSTPRTCCHLRGVRRRQHQPADDEAARDRCWWPPRAACSTCSARTR
jgi:superfamily II DNA/RNA helicase